MAQRTELKKTGKEKEYVYKHFRCEKPLGDRIDAYAAKFYGGNLSLALRMMAENFLDSVQGGAKS